MYRLNKKRVEIADDRLLRINLKGKQKKHTLRKVVFYFSGLISITILVKVLTISDLSSHMKKQNKQDLSHAKGR